MTERAPFDPANLRAQFPILGTFARNRPLVYLDNAATTQKPKSVIAAISRYYEEENANIHRGLHYLSELATKRYDDAREKVREFVNAAEAREVVFVRGTTEAINLVASTFGRANVGPGDEVLISGMEHHSNIVPWQMLCDEKDAQLRVIPVADDGSLVWSEFCKLLNERTRIVSIVYVSNALGTINPIKRVVEAAHSMKVPVFVDAAQAAPHLPLDVRHLGCDFAAFSGHKLYGPTGIGALYGRASLLERMRPYQGGGDMIESVEFEKSTFSAIPHKFEAGTPHIEGVIGLGAAIDFVRAAGLDAVANHEAELLEYATEEIGRIPGVRIVGTARHKVGVLSWTMEGIHPHEIGTALDLRGIAIRAGHHCAQPVMKRFGVSATARASFAMYTTRSDVEALIEGVREVEAFFR